MSELILYHTEFCHLCDEAETLLQQAGLAERYRKVDIEFDDALLEQYGVRIPVLKRTDNSKELGWPFDAEQLNGFLMGWS